MTYKRKNEKNVVKDEKNVVKDDFYFNKQIVKNLKDEKNMVKDDIFVAKDEKNVVKDEKFIYYPYFLKREKIHLYRFLCIIPLMFNFKSKPSERGKNDCESEFR